MLCNIPATHAQQESKYTHLNGELSSEESDNKVKVMHHDLIPETQTNDFFLQKLLKEVNFDESISDEEVTRVRKRDLITGRITGKNIWTADQVSLLKAYIQYLITQNQRIHFGPIAKLLKKPRRDCQLKYEEIFVKNFTEDEKVQLQLEVQRMMRESCYVDFQALSLQFQKPVQFLVKTAVETQDGNWTQKMDSQLKEFVMNSQEFPPFWSLIAQQLEVYELSCLRRYQHLNVRKAVWTEEEAEELKNWWEKWRKERFLGRTVFKEEVRGVVKGKAVWEIRENNEHILIIDTIV